MRIIERAKAGYEALPSMWALIFARSLRKLFGMSRAIFHDVIFARRVGWVGSAPLARGVVPPLSLIVNQWCTRPRAPSESHANFALGSKSVTVLRSRCVPNCFAVV